MNPLNKQTIGISGHNHKEKTSNTRQIHINC
jgi:hypothetical protein